MRMTYNEVMLLSNVAKTTAQDRLRNLRKILKKKKNQDITLEDYCIQYGYNLETAIKFLKG